MKLAARHFAVAVLGFCPIALMAQDASLPSAPSAVAAQRDVQQNVEFTFPVIASQVTLSAPSARFDSSQKFSNFVEQSMSPYATFSSAITAGFRPAWNSSQYSDYASRMGHSMADQTEDSFFTKFLLPSMLHQDPRYYRSSDDGDTDRAAYAISRVFITRNDNGRPTLNTSELIGAVLAASLSTAYHPYRRATSGQVAGNAAGTIGSDAGINMLREFWPDIRERLMDHGPKMMQGMVARFAPRTIPNTFPPAN
jgi:hypothetical protein